MLPSPLSALVIVWALLLAWLAICVIFDLRSRQVPAFLTVLPLILAAIWQLIQGGWQLVVLVALLILISDLPQAKWRIPIACAAMILSLSLAGSPGVVYAMLVVFGVWALWEIGATGGADAKIIIALVLFFADGLLFIPIVLVGGVQGLVGLIARRKTIPYTVAIALGTVAWLWMVNYPW
jgi:prepilin signal peptidase PulO-like enzyme (type II secretory pathway)